MTQRLPLSTKKSMPTWMVGILTLLYLCLLAALVFLPGGSLLERLRWLDSGICAQLPTHSFAPGGQLLPLCARNTGIYLGFVLTLITLVLAGRGRAQRLPSRSLLVLLIAGIVALAIDGFNSFLLDLGLFHLYQPHNLLRLLTGLLTGLALATLILPVLNRLIWCFYDEQRTVTSWPDLLRFIPALILAFFAVASISSRLLYPIALLSTLGLVTMLSSINLIVLITLSRREQDFTWYRELLPFFSFAFLCAIGELLALAQLKLMLVQTFL